MTWKSLLESLEVPEPDEPPVARGAVCVACGERRRACLANVALFGALRPLCGNCSLRRGRLATPPRSLGELVAALQRRAPDAAGEISVDEHPELVLDEVLVLEPRVSRAAASAS